MKTKKCISALDSYLGTIDGLIFYMYRGRRCVRKKPLKVQPPSTPGQIAQQKRLASIAIFYQALKEVGIYKYWQRAAKGMVQNGYNLLVQRNLPAFNCGGVICDFSKLRLTVGTVALPDGLRVSGTEVEGEWRVEWNETPDLVNASPDDRLRLYVMRDYRTFAVKPLECGEVCRKDGSTMFRVPEKWKEYRHLYAVFYSKDEKKCSENKYFNLICIS